MASVFLYAFALAGSLFFYFFYPGHISFYALVLVLILPLISLLLTLPYRRRYALELTPVVSSPVRGEKDILRLGLKGPRGEGRERLTLTFRVTNLLYPQFSQKKTVILSPQSPREFPIPTDHCGWVEIAPLKCTLPDWMGLFNLSIPLPRPVMVLVLPRKVLLPPGLDLSPDQGASLLPRPGGGPGEDYELRAYRPGDPVNAIHWKLTAKRPEEEDPVLRETVEPLQACFALCYDHFGPPPQLDLIMDQLHTLAHVLLDKEKTFTVCFTSPGSGGVTYYDVDCVPAWEKCYRALAAQPAPITGQSFSGVPALPGHSGPVRWLKLTGEEGDG